MAFTIAAYSPDEPDVFVCPIMSRDANSLLLGSGVRVRVRVRKIKGPTKPLMASLDSTLECKTGCFIPLKDLVFLSHLYPRLQVWFDWFNTTQVRATLHAYGVCTHTVEYVSSAHGRGSGRGGWALTTYSSANGM